MVKHNKHWLQTHLDLQQLTFKLIQEIPESKITVSKICKLNHINRSTFYEHYLDTLDLINQTKNATNQRLMNVFYKKSKKYNFEFLNTISIKLYLQFMKSNSDYYKIILNTNKKFPIDEGSDYLYQLIQNSFAKSNMNISSSDAMYYFIAFQSSFTNITRQWAMNDYQDDIDKMTKIIINSLPHILYLAIHY